MTSIHPSAVPPLTQLTEDEQMFREAVRDFAEREIKPLVSAMDHAAEFDKSLLPKLGELGLMGIDIPEQYGGAGGSFFMSVLAVEELARVDASTAVLVDVHNTLMNVALGQFGSDDLKARYFPKLAGSWVGAYALSEAGSGSDAFALTCRAFDKGDHYELTGRKLWITNAAEAELFIVMANLDPAKGYKGITAFLVERGFEGFAVGKKESKLGIRASSTCELILERCKVPDANVLGPVGLGYKISIETLNEGRIGIGAQMVGISQGALEAALAHVKERKQFGKPIVEFQGVQFQLAQMRTDLEAARLIVYNAARLKDGGKAFATEAAMAKLFSSQVADKITSNALELFGGYGYSKEYPAEKFYRDAKIGTIYEGTSNMQLMTVAKSMLKP